jgi:hypothetical protein
MTSNDATSHDHERPSNAQPEADQQRTDHPDEEHRDPGAYVGREPERQAATIPGGISSKDERIAAHSTQSGAIPAERPARGHREGVSADDGEVREAGQAR